MDTNKRIVVNTFAQHIRAIVNILMSLFATRYILLALGSSDFGIFSLIGSTVAMLGLNAIYLIVMEPIKQMKYELYFLIVFLSI